MAAPALYTYKTKGGMGGGLWWAAVFYLGRYRKSTERFAVREDAQAAARAIIANERALDTQRVYQAHMGGR